MDGPARTVFATDDPDVNPYRLLTSLVVPRPIAWVSSLAADGTGNLAPHSFFTVASARPPVVQFTSVGAKDTLRNVRETGEFVVNLASRPLLDLVNNSSARFDAGTDEAQALGVAMEPSVQVSPPRVVDSPASIECTLHSVIEVGDSFLVLGDVVAMTVHEAALVDGVPSMVHLEPVSRLGGSEWGMPPDVVEVTRPQRPPV